MKTGFIGLGIMEMPLCKNLIKTGYLLVVLNRSKAAVDEMVAAGVCAVETLIHA